jgi:hypothetical protein
MCAVLVPLVAGAQAAQAACTDPVIQNTFPYATAGQLVPLGITGVTPGTEYLVKVNGREVKQGVADSDIVQRKFRMPKLGDKRRDARVVVVLANDGCENSPWKVKQELGYRPPPVEQKATEKPAAPPVTQQPAQSTPAPTPTPAPAISSPAPKPVKPVQTKPFIPKQPAGVVGEPSKDARAWLTPLDVYSRNSEPPPQPPRDPLDRKTEDANSTAALVGLAGLFILVSGIAALCWTRFRRYDDEQLSTLLNPEGKLPALLDDKAIDLGTAGMTGAAGAIAAADADRATEDKEDKERAAEIAAAQAQMTPRPVVPAASIKAPIVPPAAIPAANGNGSHVNGTNGAHVGNGAHAANGGNGAASSYRQEVESELQRILKEAGLDAELEGILTDARAQAERQGVPMDSELMLRALTDETGGSAKLSDSAKGELKQRFQRIAAEERGDARPAGDQ